MDAATPAVAEVLLPASDLHADMPFYEALGFRLDAIWPADDPAVAIMSGHGLRLRLERGLSGGGALRILTGDEARHGRHMSPGGVSVEIAPLEEQLPPLETQHAFIVRQLRDSAPWVIGRAGMQYRDLIPHRLGGSIIASHIRIPDGGPVPDMVHFHRVGFQLIYCYKGWVDLVYEDQGPEFRLHAGDCVIQPPQIRHRVLHASDGLEVIEIGVPAEHVTEIDHQMTLPTPHLRPERDFGGQVFVRHRVKDAQFAPWRMAGFDHRETGIAAATRGVANVHIARAAGGVPPITSHDTDILFTFVLSGTMVLEGEGRAPVTLAPGDAFTIPPGIRTRYAAPSADLELLEIALAADFATTLHEGF